ncbi:hypothetical protein JYT97_00610 [Haliea sp. AH-315-K21]|uniref:DUF1570 domain-containing protein n=1 Tax=SAR86 cluster bacterium TaxID=2030880 RepID=A0A2A5CHE5_9GAMM|nr:hypothetical protein [Haliea sp. AH-315-K21]PCJ42870.1 MAG: hypothetical protein COA71_05085 [SAR86 cluster bacterium]
MRNFFTVSFTLLLVAGCSSNQVNYNDYSWSKLNTPRFTVFSQLDEQDTFEWAQDFDIFITVIQQVIQVDESRLPPLDIVLFNSERDFAPYRTRSESGVNENVLAFFSNQGSWSIIGVPANIRRDDAQRVTYHEAVHWYSSSLISLYPLWFAEGIAEVFSTLEIDGNTVKWGTGIPRHVAYLRFIEGLQPLETFFNVSAENALNIVDTYYPQSWFLVHYLLFGDNQLSPDALNNLLTEIQTTGLNAAVENALGMDIQSMDVELQDYLDNGTYRVAQATLERSDFTSNIGPSTDAELELVLAKLALSGSNTERAHAHATILASLAPNEVSTYDIIAFIAAVMDDKPTLEVALNNALALNSVDSKTYQIQAEFIFEENFNESDNYLDEDAARQIVDLYSKSITLLPYELDNYKNLIRILSQVENTSVLDQQIIEIGSVIFPNEGIFVLGRAIIEHSKGNNESALDLLNQAISEIYKTDSSDRNLRRYLLSVW